jgi:hypothetical protein
MSRTKGTSGSAGGGVSPSNVTGTRPFSFRRPTTKSGLDLSSCVSCLQKATRRGDIYLAVSMAKELLRSGMGAYAWRRVMVIASEDVGPAAPHIPALVQALYQNALVLSRKKQPTGDDLKLGELPLLHAVIAMCVAPKTRIVAEVAIVAEYHAKRGNLPAIPDYALDCHTDEGRRRGIRKGTAAAIEHWKIGRVISPEVVIDDRWKIELDEIWSNPENYGLGFVFRNDDEADTEEG